MHEQNPWIKFSFAGGYGIRFRNARRKSNSFWVVAAALLGLMLGGCGATRMLEFSTETPEAHTLKPDMFTLVSPPDAEVLARMLRPSEQHLSSWKDLSVPLQASRKYVSTQDPDQVAIAHGTFSLTWGEVERTLDRLAELLPRLDAEPELLAMHFRWIRLSQDAAFSGYYEPVFKASRTRKTGYTYPLYRIPPDLKETDLSLFKPDYIGQRLMYRLNKGLAVPYYSRAEIDGTGGKRGVLHGKNLEISWLADPMDAYFLHVQGSGRLTYEDGSEQRVLFAASNGRPYLSLGKYLSGIGEIPADKVSMQSIRRWLAEHPAQSQELLQRNQRYVFFRTASGDLPGPIGTLGTSVTPWVSLAVDRTTFPLGALLAFDIDLPTPTGSSPLRGLGFAQDTGEAITENRVDLFCGKGPSAEYIAGHLNSPGEIWMLLAI